MPPPALPDPDAVGGPESGDSSPSPGWPPLRPTFRALGAASSFSLWMLLLLAGWAFGGAIHLLLVLALGLFPWRSVRRPTAAAGSGPSSEEAT